MEASQSCQRRLVQSLSRAFQCQCRISSAPIRHRAPPPRPRKHLLSSSRAFSTSHRRRQEYSSPSQASVSSSTPPVDTPKQALRSYISSVQAIVDGFKLQDKMAPRQHEQLLVALSRAEAALDAPGQRPDAFPPLLQSLQGEVDPVLQRQFGTTDIQTLRTKAARQGGAPSSPSKEPFSQPRPSIAQGLNSVFGPPPSRSPAPARPAPEPISDRDFSGLSSIYKPKTNKLNGFHDILGGQRPSGRLSEMDRANSLALNSQDTYDGSHIPGREEIVQREVLRLKPTLGRTVEVNQGSDLTRAFRTMEALCARNKVKHDQIKQRFHVRRGQMRKNLRISRWRKLFMEGFLEECKRVRRMRKQGW